MKEKISKKILISVLILLIYILIWYIAAIIVNKELLIPKPSTVLNTFLYFAGQKEFYINVLYSIGRICAGFILAIITGSLLAFLTSFVPASKRMVSPAISIIKATPVASFIILTLLWIKTTYVPVFISFLMVLPVVWTNISQGFETADKKLLEMAFVYKMDFIKKIKYIYIPNCVSYFKSSVISGIGLAWKSGIAAEVICSPKFAIGSRLYSAKIYLETAELFAWTGTVVILSIIIERITVKILENVFKED